MVPVVKELPLAAETPRVNAAVVMATAAVLQITVVKAVKALLAYADDASPCSW